MDNNIKENEKPKGFFSKMLEYPKEVIKNPIETTKGLFQGFSKNLSDSILSIVPAAAKNLEFGFKSFMQTGKEVFNGFEIDEKKRQEIKKINDEKYKPIEDWYQERRKEIAESQLYIDSEKSKAGKAGEFLGNLGGEVYQFYQMFKPAKTAQVAMRSKQLSKATGPKAVQLSKRLGELKKGAIAEELPAAFVANIPYSIKTTIQKGGDFEEFKKEFLINQGLELATLGAAKFLKGIFKKAKKEGTEFLDETARNIRIQEGMETPADRAILAGGDAEKPTPKLSETNLEELKDKSILDVASDKIEGLKKEENIIKNINTRVDNDFNTAIINAKKNDQTAIFDNKKLKEHQTKDFPAIGEKLTPNGKIERHGGPPGGDSPIEKPIKEFELKQETKPQFIQRQLQDKMNRLNTVQKAIEKSGGKIDESADAFLKQELFIGRASKQIEDIEEQFFKPKKIGQKSFVQKLADKKISIKDFGDYLHAKHARERNAHISTINKDFPDGGSGMVNEQADEILRKLDTEEMRNFEKYFKENVIEKRLKILEESGLEKPETINKLRNYYKNYVPLKKAEVKDFGGKGKGFSVSGKNIKRAKGSKSERANPFVQAIVDLENTIIKAEKNKVAQSFLKLVEQNPNKKVWNVEKLKYTPKFNAEGEMVSMDPRFKFADNVIEVREKGGIKLITIEDAALAESMKNLGVEKGIKILDKINSYFRAINTTLNPEFVITNFERDIQTALINVGGEHGVKMAAKVIKDIPAAMKGIYRNTRGKDLNKWGKIYEEMKTAGGKMGWFDQGNIKDKIKDVENLANRHNKKGVSASILNGISAIGEYIENINEVVESAVRLSAYKNAIDVGLSKERAASIAKNLTVNFNTKGRLGSVLNSLYLFANAGIQGSTRILKALKKPRTRKIVGGVVAGAYFLNQFNETINEESYKKIPEHIKNNNLIFMTPSGKYIQIKSPYGYNVFKVLGDSIHDLVNQNKTPAEVGKNLLSAIDNSFNPLSSGSLPQFLSPTFADPFVQLSENKNFFGGAIMPEQPVFSPHKKDSALYFKSVRETSKKFTNFLNKITGGNEKEAGFIDVSPETIDHFVDFLTGGVGKFVANTIETGGAVIDGEMPDVQNIPFLRKFIGEPSKNFEKYKTREMFESSGIKRLTPAQKNEFFLTLKKAISTGQLEIRNAKKYFTAFAKNQSEIEKMRGEDFIKEVQKYAEIGIKIGLYKKDETISFARNAIREKYNINGNITTKENLNKFKNIPEKERNFLLSMYSEKTKNTITKKLKEATNTKSIDKKIKKSINETKNQSMAKRLEMIKRLKMLKKIRDKK